MLGITYATASRLAYDISLLRPSFFLGSAIATFFVTCLIGLSLSRASAEIYHIRRPESFFDALPVSASTYLHTALIERFARTVIVATVILVARWLLGANAFLDRPALLPLILDSLESHKRFSTGTFSPPGTGAHCRAFRFVARAYIRRWRNWLPEPVLGLIGERGLGRSFILFSSRTARALAFLGHRVCEAATIDRALEYL
jgi:hypothetical protein